MEIPVAVLIPWRNKEHFLARENVKEESRWSAAEQGGKEIGSVAVAAIETTLSGVSATDVNSHVSS